MKLFSSAILLLIISVLMLSSCEEERCYHRDADDNDVCDRCGEAYTDKIDITSPEDETDTDTPPCEHIDANADSLCDACDEDLSTQEDVHVHSFGDWEQVYEDDHRTCDKRDYKRSCSDCHEVERRSGTPDDHDLSAVTVESTCVIKGNIVTSCSLCSYKVEETLPLSAHSYPDSFAASGFTHRRICTVCGDITDYAEHTMTSEDTCTVCGYKPTPTVGIKYALSADGSYAEVTAYSGSEVEIILAEKYLGVPVKQIGAYAFYESKIKRVFIPDTVTVIADSAFYGCNKLTEVDIPDSVTHIGRSAFADCAALSSLSLGKGVVHVGNEAFRDCSSSIYTEHESIIYLSDNDNPYAAVLCPSDRAASSYALHEDTELISANAFMECDSMTEIYIPSSVRGIGEFAFKDCFALVRVYIEDLTAWCKTEIAHSADNSSCPTKYANDLYLKDEDKPITDLVIPDGVSSVGAYAFLGCKSIRTVTIPTGVLSIGADAFAECTSIEEVLTPDLKSWLSIRFETSASNPLANGCPLYVGEGESRKRLTELALPEDIHEIGDFAFIGCESLKIVRLHNKLEKIGVDAFSGCEAVDELYIPDVYSWCQVELSSQHSNPISHSGSLYITADDKSTLLTELIIPDGISIIPDYAFCGCESVTSVFIPSSVNYVGVSAFKECDSVTAVIVSDPSYWARISFADKDANPLIHGSPLYIIEGEEHKLVTSITVPEEVTKISSFAFIGWKGLTKITLHDKITAIGESAFSGCASLSEIILPDTVISVGDSAFKDCRSLTKASLGLFIEDIGSYAFSGCSALVEINLGKALLYIGEYAFSGCHSLPFILIPRSVIRIDAFAIYDCMGLEIFCEIEEIPEGWDPNWRPLLDTTVSWGYEEIIA